MPSNALIFSTKFFEGYTIMKGSSNKPYLAPSKDAGDFLEFVETGNRLRFVMHVNNILGKPNENIIKMQNEFILGELSGQAIINFVRVYRGLISCHPK